MENPGKTALRALAQSNGSGSRPSDSSVKARTRAAAVWSSMVELYGPPFVTAYGEAPSPIWLAAIAELSDDECRAGLTRLARQPREYPANLTQFVAACRPVTGSPRYLGTPITPDHESLALPPPDRRSRPEVIDGWIAKMRAKVGA